MRRMDCPPRKRDLAAECPSVRNEMGKDGESLKGMNGEEWERGEGIGKHGSMDGCMDGWMVPRGMIALPL